MTAEGGAFAPSLVALREVPEGIFFGSATVKPPLTSDGFLTRGSYLAIEVRDVFFAKSGCFPLAPA